MKPPVKCIGKTLSELKIRNKYGLQVLAVRTTETAEESDGKASAGPIVIPDAMFRIEGYHILIIMGENKNIEKFRKLS